MPGLEDTLFPLFKEIISQFLLSHNIDLVIFWSKFSHWSNTFWYVCLFLSTIFFAGIIYFINKVMEIRRIEHERVYGQVGLIEEIKDSLEIILPKKNPDWDKINKLISSDNPNDWKLAIIEADKMLEVVVNTFSVPGDNIGDKLKNIERSDFTNLEEAWQAHKVRNRIAHEHNFHLGQREARLAIDNFEKVFKEFDFI